MTYARMPIRTALAIGAGTAKATRAVAAHGIRVTATDPDPAMLAELPEHVPPTVSILQAAFEELALSHTYDLSMMLRACHGPATC